MNLKLDEGLDIGLKRSLALSHSPRQAYHGFEVVEAIIESADEVANLHSHRSLLVHQSFDLSRYDLQVGE